MSRAETEIRLDHVMGLREFVLDELSRFEHLSVSGESERSVYLNDVEDISLLKSLRAVSKAYIVMRGKRFDPYYIYRHKSILGDLIERVIDESKERFSTFKVVCAGADSKEVRAIAEYIEKTFRMVESEDADMKAHIVKMGEVWEVGVQITPRPLSVRSYKVRDMEGAMDPTVAYALNSLVLNKETGSYLNVFSGSATLLIEAGLYSPDIKRLVGFDNSKERISLAIQNVKKAGLIRRVELKERDIFDAPDLGKFDVITSDLPFGMYISKGEDLKALYRSFVDYCQGALNPEGRLAVYTGKGDIFREVIAETDFKVKKAFKLKTVTAVNAYMNSSIFVCEFGFIKRNYDHN